MLPSLNKVIRIIMIIDAIYIKFIIIIVIIIIIIVVVVCTLCVTGNILQNSSLGHWEVNIICIVVGFSLLCCTSKPVFSREIFTLILFQLY